MLKQMRGLAAQGRVVVVVTHSVHVLTRCDNVVVLAPGGRVAYFGPPSGVLQHFGYDEYDAVFTALEHNPDLWKTLPTAQGATASTVGEGPPHHATEHVLPATPARGRWEVLIPNRRAENLPTWLRLAPLNLPAPALLRVQLATLVHRNLAVVRADRVLLAMLIGMPVALGLLSRLVSGDAGLSLLSGSVDMNGLLVAKEAAQRITVLIVGACLMGTALTISGLIGERTIFQREYAAGLFVDIYLLSKVVTFGGLSFVQGLVMTFLATAGLPGPDFGGAIGLATVEIALVIGALSATMTVVGLLVSGLLTSSEQTMPALVGVVMVQLVLSGALIEIAGRALIGQVAWFAPARWAYTALASSTSIQRPVRAIGGDLDWAAQHGGAHWVANVAMLGFLLLASLAGAVWATRRSASER